MNKHVENAIKEKRTIEATKKNLMGQTGKFASILQVFGEKIIRQGGGISSGNYLEYEHDDDDVFEEYESTLSGQNGPLMYRDEIKEMDDDVAFEEGMLFDGLSMGIHLEIIYWNNDNELIVNYKGNKIFYEVAGELYGYLPDSEWEKYVDKLYIVAKAKLKKMKEIEEEETKKMIEIKKEGLIERLRKKWGI